MYFVKFPKIPRGKIFVLVPEKKNESPAEEKYVKFSEK